MCSSVLVGDAVYAADLVIGAVLLPGAKAPWLITKDMLPNMRTGSVVVDVSVDQGGCIETTHATTHADPTYVVDGVVHYGVANMPGPGPNPPPRPPTKPTLPSGTTPPHQGGARPGPPEGLALGTASKYCPGRRRNASSVG